MMIIKKSFHPPLPGKRSVNLSIGTFDSLHRGHIRVLDELKKSSRQDKVISCVITFENRPRHILSRRNDGMILENKERLACFKAMGIGLLYFLRFTKKFSRLSPEQFLRKVTGSLKVNRIVVGEDFRFGRRNRGDTGTLRRLQKKFCYKLVIIRNLMKNKEKVSTTLIKRFILHGEVDKANALLGRTFHINGRVMPGKGLGKKIRFPTINLELINKNIILPESGVYLTRVLYAGHLFDGMTYAGIDFMTRKFVIETHIFHFHKDIYRKKVSLFFLKKVRQEMRFPSVWDLKAQLVRDKVKAMGLMRRYDKRSIVEKTVKECQMRSQRPE